MKRNRFYQKHEWLPCERCGQFRWVMIVKGKPRSKLCRGCHAKDVSGINAAKFNNYTTKVDGYIFVRHSEHPKANYNGYVSQSRLVLEKKLGRYLFDGYEPHHLNGIKTDDTPANLVEVSHSAHSTITNYNRKTRY